MAETVEFISVPNGQPAGSTHSINAIVETERVTNNDDEVAEVDIEATLHVNDSSIGDLSVEGVSGNAFPFEFVNHFANSADYQLRIEATIDYFGISGYSRQSEGDETVIDRTTITISEGRQERRERITQDEGQNYATAFKNRASTLITDIETDSDVTLPFSEIDFGAYDNPNISLDTSSRFSVHEIIGGTTVRQKIGEDPTEVTMDGVCTEEVATQIDELHRAKLVTLLSDRVPNGLRCQIASTSTDPLDDGGAADLDGGEFLYEYSINMVEIDQVV